MTTKTAGEGEEQDVGLRVDGRVEGQLKPGEKPPVNIRADLGFGVSFKAMDGLPCRVKGGTNNVIPFF